MPSTDFLDEGPQFVADANDRAEYTKGDIVLADVTSKYASKTNITAFLLLIFGILTATGTLPASVATPEAVGGVVSAGAILVAFFRTIATSILK